eukprot:Transcript_5195.p5 GENE.Transcript_5195~~Transcript_5195.p5  ORF type:complete len:121 (+),score=7.74 Transcript_5195:698-1060(+)
MQSERVVQGHPLLALLARKPSVRQLSLPLDDAICDRLHTWQPVPLIRSRWSPRVVLGECEHRPSILVQSGEGWVECHLVLVQRQDGERIFGQHSLAAPQASLGEEAKSTPGGPDHRDGFA